MNGLGQYVGLEVAVRTPDEELFGFVTDRMREVGVHRRGGLLREIAVKFGLSRSPCGVVTGDHRCSTC